MKFIAMKGSPRFSLKFSPMLAQFWLLIWVWVLSGANAADLPTWVQIESLSLPYASPWQRAAPEQESEALELVLPQAGLQLAVLRHTMVLTTDAETYYARLSRNWRSLYGQDVRIGWFEAGASKWLYCQRPAQAGDATAWQFSSVFAGRAYSVMLFAPSLAANGEQEIPSQAVELLAVVRWGDVAAESSSPSPQRPAKPYWIKARTLFPQANADVLEALVQDDQDRLGRDGLLTGYGLDFSQSSSQSSTRWFIEGYVWKTLNARLERVALNAAGRLEFESLAAADDVARLVVRLSQIDQEADLGVRLRIWSLCAPAEQLAETLRQLRQGARLPLQRLARAPAAGCPNVELDFKPDSDLNSGPGFAPIADWRSVLQGESGKTVEAEVTVKLQPALSTNQQAALSQAGLTRLVLLEIAPYARPGRTGFGDQLIERARGYLVFEAGEAPKAGKD